MLHKVRRIMIVMRRMIQVIVITMRCYVQVNTWDDNDPDVMCCTR